MSEKITALSRVATLDSTKTNSQYPAWKYVIPIPPDNLMWSVGGASIENFLIVGDAWAQVINRFAPENCTILDVGCGCGRTACVLVNNRWITRYIGFDVIRENIGWCRQFLAAHWQGKGEFYWFDLYSDEYNPSGAIKAQQFIFPCETASADIVIGASVFTHLLEPDALHYLHETSRVLSERGKAIFSIHVEPLVGERFSGTETRIDIEPAYFLELAAQAGLVERDRIPDLAGQYVFVLERDTKRICDGACESGHDDAAAGARSSAERLIPSGRAVYSEKSALLCRNALEAELIALQNSLRSRLQSLEAELTTERAEAENRIEIERIRGAALGRELDERKRESVELRARLESECARSIAIEQELQAERNVRLGLEQSVSWRLTKPGRTLMKAVRMHIRGL